MKCHRNIDMKDDFSEGMHIECGVSDSCPDWCEYGLSRYNTYVVKVENGKRILAPFGEPSQPDGGKVNGS